LFLFIYNFDSFPSPLITKKTIRLLAHSFCHRLFIKSASIIMPENANTTVDIVVILVPNYTNRHTISSENKQDRKKAGSNPCLFVFPHDNLARFIVVP